MIELAERLDRLLLLRQPHRPGDDRAVGFDVAVGEFVDLVRGQPGGREDVGFVEVRQVRRELVEAERVAIEELVVEHRAGAGLLGLEHALADGLQERHVATGADLQELVRQRGAVPDQPAHGLRVLVPDEARLRQRVHRDDRGARAFRILECGEHPGMVRARVLAHDDDQVGVLEVVVGDRRFSDADRLGEGGPRRLVAHVRAVGKIVRAERAHEQLVEERRLIGGAAARIEGGAVGRVEPVQSVGDQPERLVPGHRAVMVFAGRFEDRLDEPPLHPEPVFRLLEQVGDGVLGPEARRHGDRCRLPRHRLGPVLAELEGLALVRVGPGAAHAVEAVLLVDRRQQLRGSGGSELGERGLHRIEDPGDARGLVLVRADGEIGVVRPVVERFLRHAAVTFSAGSGCRMRSSAL